MSCLRCWMLATLAAAMWWLGSARSASAGERPILLAYVPSWRQPAPDAVPLDRLTHLCHAFVRATPEGKIESRAGLPDPALVEHAHARGVRVLLSIGGAESDTYLAPVASDPARLDRFVAAVITMVETHGYDGIDLDWEFPNAEDSARGFVAMTDALRAAVDDLESRTGKDYLLTAAVGGAWAYRPVPDEVFRERFDFLNVMAYDHTGPWTDYAGHHSALGRPSQHGDTPPRNVENMLRHWQEERGVPASRLVLGLPAYGRGFRVSQPYAPVAKDREQHTFYSYTSLAEKMTQGWTVERLDNGEPWLVAPERSEIVGFDDPASIRRKVEWAKAQQLRGVFFWQALGDRLPDGSHPLIDAAAEALGEAAPSDTP